MRKTRCLLLHLPSKSCELKRRISEASDTAHTYEYEGPRTYMPLLDLDDADIEVGTSFPFEVPCSQETWEFGGDTHMEGVSYVLRPSPQT